MVLKCKEISDKSSVQSYLIKIAFCGINQKNHRLKKYSCWYGSCVTPFCDHFPKLLIIEYLFAEKKVISLETINSRCESIVSSLNLKQWKDEWSGKSEKQPFLWFPVGQHAKTYLMLREEKFNWRCMLDFSQYSRPRQMKTSAESSS